MKHQIGELGGTGNILANKLFGHHNGMEDVLQGCGD